MHNHDRSVILKLAIEASKRRSERWSVHWLKCQTKNNWVFPLSKYSKQVYFIVHCLCVAACSQWTNANTPCTQCLRRQTRMHHDSNSPWSCISSFSVASTARHSACNYFSFSLLLFLAEPIRPKGMHAQAKQNIIEIWQTISLNQIDYSCHG